MSTEVLSVRSAKAEPTERANTLVSKAVGLLGAAGAIASLLIVGDRATAALVTVAGLGFVWSLAGLVLATCHRCPAASIVQAFALTTVLGSLAWSIDIDRRPGGAAALAVDLVVRLSVCLTPAVFMHLLLTLPDGRVASAGLRRALIGVDVVALAVGLVLLVDRDRVARWPLVLLWASCLFSAPTAHARYRRAGVADQRRLQWIGWAGVVAAEVALVSMALGLVTEWPAHVPEIALASTVLVPLALMAGTVPRLLARVDRLLTHTVSLTGLTALIVAAYLVALAAFGRKPDGSEKSLLLLSMLAAAGAALAYQPARGWLTDRANHVVYGERVSPDEALRTWGSRLTRAIPLDELLLQLAETLRKSMQLRSAQIWTGSEGHYEIAAMVPHRSLVAFSVAEKERSVVSRAGVSGGTWLDIWLPGLVDPSATASTRVAPIAHSGELLGLVVCERPADGASFTEEDDRVLTELARQVGLALHNVQLDTALQASLDELRATNDELRISRVRIVAAGDAERRKLERNLHDGAQQHLVALAVKLRLAKDAVADDPADAEAMIDEVRADLQEAIAELRALAHGIFPPLLMSGGLAEALPAAAGRAALPSRTEIEVSRHPPEVEAAVYFCCMEALQNAGKYAGPEASATVRVWEESDSLCWQVVDDGPGFEVSSSAGTGHGFVNMRDRMGSFGGDVVVTSASGAGTTISGRLPLD